MTTAAALVSELRTSRRKPDLAATLARDELAAALRWATSGLSLGRTVLPVLRGALLHAEGGALRVTTFDYECSAEMSVLAPGASGHALVPAELLVSMLHVIPRGVDVRLTVKRERLILEGGDDVEMSLPLLPIEEWPQPPEPGDFLFTTTGEHFARLGRVTVASGRDDSLPILTATNVESLDGRIVAAATDRYRLAVASIKGHFPARIGPLKVPSRALSRLAKAFAKEAGVAVYLSRDLGGPGGDHATFISGSRTFHARLLDGEFPKYRSLMEHAVVGRLTAPTEGLRLATRQAAVAVQRAPVVARFADPTVMEITGGLGSGHTGEPTVRAKVREVTYEGPEVRVGVNPAFLTDGLNAVGGERVHAAIGGDRTPLTLTSPEDDSFSYLLMPVRLAD